MADRTPPCQRCADGHPDRCPDPARCPCRHHVEQAAMQAAAAIGAHHGIAQVASMDLWAELASLLDRSHHGATTTVDQATTLVPRIIDLGWRPVCQPDVAWDPSSDPLAAGGPVDSRGHRAVAP